MKNISITNPCNEDWSSMHPTQNGAYCDACSMEVFDFTNKSTDEIKQILKSQLGSERICGRLSIEQEIELNREFEQWCFNAQRRMQRAMLFSLIAVFGLTLFSCASKQDEERILEVQESIAAVVQPVEKIKVDVEQAKDVKSVQVVPRKECLTNELVPELEEVIEFEEEEVQALEEITSREIISFAGGVRFSQSYLTYLEETVEDIEEYDEFGVLIPEHFETKAYPNPTAGEVSLEVKLPVAVSQMHVKVFDAHGRFIQDVYHGEMRRGTRTLSLDLSDQVPGLYLVTLNSTEFQETIRVSKR